MRELGKILKSDENGIEISVNSGHACSGCNACFIDKNQRHILKIQQDIKVKPGEMVELEVQPVFAVKSALLLFLLPLLMLILGYYIFTNLLPASFIQMPYRGISGALLGILLSFSFVHLYDKHLQKAGQDTRIRIVKVVGS
jgi:positive regulator of sigma E activity